VASDVIFGESRWFIAAIKNFEEVIQVSY